MKKNINRIAFFNILSILLLQGISVISSPIFSRLLGTDGYGNLTSFTVWAGIACTVFSVMTNMTIPNARVEYAEGEQDGYQSSVMTLSLLVFAVGGILMAVLAGPISDFLKFEKYMVALLLVQALGAFGTNFLNSKFTYEFQADKNMVLSVFMAVATMGLSLLLVLLLPEEQRFVGRILGTAVVYGGVGIAACAWILRRGKTFYHPGYWKFCLLLSVPMVFQNLSYQVLGNSDILMLKQMVGASDSGIYSLAFTLAQIMFTIFTALNNSWTPFFFDDMKEGRRENAARQAEHFLELFTVLSMGFVLLCREVYQIYADESFWAGTQLLPIFVSSYYVNFLCTFPVNFEYFHKKTGVVAAATIGAAMINLGMNYVFILKFGMMGAAVATLLSHCIQFAMHEVYSRLVLGKKSYPFKMLTWMKYAAAYSACVAVFYLLPDWWLLRWGLGALIGAFELWRMWQRKGLL